MTETLRSIFEAIECDDLGALQVLACRCPKVVGFYHEQFSHFTALGEACRFGRTEMVRFLLECPGVTVEPRHPSGYGPLSLVCATGHEDIVRLLLGCGKDVGLNTRQWMGHTPLTLACGRGRPGVVRLLLGDPLIKVRRTCRAGHSPLFYAAYHGHLEIVGLLLLSPNIDVNQCSAQRATPFFVACQRGHVGVVKLLLADLRVNVSAPIHYSITPLWFAAQLGHLEVVQHLVASGRDIALTAVSSWNQRTAAEHALAQVGLPRGHLETPDDYVRRVAFGTSIATLLDSAALSPRNTRNWLCFSVPNIRDLWVAEVFALAVLLCDDYVTLVSRPPPTGRLASIPGKVTITPMARRLEQGCCDAWRYLRTATTLPPDLQRVLANRTFGSSAVVIRREALALSLKKLAHHLSLLPLSPAVTDRRHFFPDTVCAVM